jgi:hypothetical protein
MLKTPEMAGARTVELPVAEMLSLFLMADEAEHCLDGARDQRDRLAAFLAAEMHPPCVQPGAGPWRCPQFTGHHRPDERGEFPQASCLFGRRIDEIDHTQSECWCAWSAEPREAV